jgi:hypothetical protein
LISMTNRPEILDTAIASRFKGNTITVKLTKEVRSTVWYNQLQRNTFLGLDNASALNRLSEVSIDDLRIITDICSKSRSDIYSGRRFFFDSLTSTAMSTPLPTTGSDIQVPPESSIDITDPKCIIWFYVEEYKKECQATQLDSNAGGTDVL